MMMMIVIMVEKNYKNAIFDILVILKFICIQDALSKSCFVFISKENFTCDSVEL